MPTYGNTYPLNTPPHTLEIYRFFSLIVFGGTEVLIVYILLCCPSEDSLAVHCRQGRLLVSNPGLQFHNLVATNEPQL
jgi:hypothetical protein